MIGMIALAGIVVRNSIILIDFIHHSLARGLSLEGCHPGGRARIRLRPIALTAGAADVGLGLPWTQSSRAWHGHSFSEYLPPPRSR